MKNMIRPKREVLPDSALVPNRNLVPPPTRFTHRVKADTPFYFRKPGTKSKPAKSDGTLSGLTSVRLLTHDGGTYCRVADAQGLKVTVAFSALAPLS